MSYTFTLKGDETAEFAFGNVDFDEADFEAKGFWRNERGTALIDADDIEALNALEPFGASVGWWDFPFDGTWVETGQAYSGAGSVGEVSDFLAAPGRMDPMPERLQLMQQLCVFVLNVRHFTPGYGPYQDVHLVLNDGTGRLASELINDAVEAWKAGDEQYCSEVRRLLQRYNQAHSLQMMILAID